MTEVEWKDGKIRDRDVEAMRSRIGQEERVRGWMRATDPDATWHYANGVGDDSRLWWEPGHGAGGPWRRELSPPTMLYAFMSGPRRPGDTQVGGVEDLLPGVFGVWAGDRWRWKRPVFQDEPIAAYSGLHEVNERETTLAGRSIEQIDRIRFVHEDSGEELATLYRGRFRIERGGARSSDRYAGYERPSYDEEELARIAAQYESEYERRRTDEPLEWDSVKVGDPLGPMVKGPLTLTNIVGWLLGWGAPLCPTNRMAHTYLAAHPSARLTNPTTNIDDTLEGAHWDPELARLSGLPDGYDFGGQRIAWLAHMVGEWMGEVAVLRELDVTLRRPNFLGDTSWLSGTVTAKEDGDPAALISCDLEIKNQNGEVTTLGRATVAVPRTADAVTDFVRSFR